MDENLDHYSVISTKIEKGARVDRDTLVKRYRPNINLPISLTDLKSLMDNYTTDLVQSGVPMPEVIESNILDDHLSYEVVNAGQNLIQMGMSHKNFRNFIPQINEIFCVLVKAIDKSIMIDPHPKNFVFFGKDIFYVDFYPPYSKLYNEIRISIAHKSEREIVEKNLSYFSSPYIAPHFCGDFINISKQFTSIFRTIFDISKEQDLFDGKFVEFTELAVEIRATEDERIARGIYLV
tara:strand:+ start:1190 stop:1897 length:708 start_codon:yes stop_codon:yes gene_type:complete